MTYLIPWMVISLCFGINFVNFVVNGFSFLNTDAVIISVFINIIAKALTFTGS
jgi:hypothetical protein